MAGGETAASAQFANNGELPPIDLIFGKPPEMQAVKHRLLKVACANVPVLIQGESGSGKEVIAKLVHQHSPWARGPFVKLNCAAIPSTLLESELFGYEKGAFTGANGSKPGRVEQADGGTLFLDEIAELTPALQAKLLQLLQDGQFSRIGGESEKRVEVRVICATHRDLEKEIEAQNFRRDLFYRINVVKITLPPLRERRQDIPVLADYFLKYYNDKFQLRAPPLSCELLSLMDKHNWPGNIRELENLIKRYVILGSEESVASELARQDDAALDPRIPIEGPISLKKVVRQIGQDVERRIILKVLQDHQWNRKNAARALSISYRALLYKIRNAGLPVKRFSPTQVNPSGKSAPPVADLPNP